MSLILQIAGTTRAQESTNAIERLYITMRHLLNRGFYKPSGVSGQALKNALLTLRPEIYGSIAEEKAELNGLAYVMERLPRGIESCQYINLTSDEGYSDSHLEPIVPPKRRRNCYRIDDKQMNIEITRGRSDIYDILTHLTFLFIESEKICARAYSPEGRSTVRDWEKLRQYLNIKKPKESEREVAYVHAAQLLGRTYREVREASERFSTPGEPDRLLTIIYELGRLAIEEEDEGAKRTIKFSPLLRERLGHHIHGERWASRIKEVLFERGLITRPLHIISANLHSVMNSLFARLALSDRYPDVEDELEIYEELSREENEEIRQIVRSFALENGMVEVDDTSGANIDVQLFDTAQIVNKNCSYPVSDGNSDAGKPVIFVMDYAFGEQAYETMDELLKPYLTGSGKHYLNVCSISIMGKAGILQGGKGDLMIPSAHIFEGTADNYPFDNALRAQDFGGMGLNVVEGSMVTVLGTSLQNKDLLRFFHESTWDVIGLEMEGVHYQKAIQAAARIRKNISPDVVLRYAYYASDNPLETGSTLASGGLGTTGVKPTYLITDRILRQTFSA